LKDYFFRNFGHLAKYSLRCFVHSLVHHKDHGDRRAEIFALITGLHHPELYSNALSVMFTRLIRGLFPDHKYIRASLDKCAQKCLPPDHAMTKRCHDITNAPLEFFYFVTDTTERHTQATVSSAAK
jgi:hypothetical protein